MTHYESFVGAPMILELKKRKVWSSAHVILESGFMHRTIAFPYLSEILSL